MVLNEQNRGMRNEKSHAEMGEEGGTRQGRAEAASDLRETQQTQ